MNKKFLALPLVLLAFGCRDRYEGQAGASSSAAPAASPYSSESTVSPATGAAVTATVVEVDAAGGTVTLRELAAPGAAPADTAGRRYNVAPSASSSLADIKAGDRVNVMCQAAPGATGTGTLMDCATITTIAPAGGAAGQ